MASIETPCVKICMFDTMAGICRGCGRTLEEIGRWASLTAQQRSTVMTQLPARLAKLEPGREREP